jgi:predicted GTPase
MIEQSTLKIAVVGHTNVGKTSLLRTLIRDVNFGKVDDMPGSTRQVQSARIMLGTQTALILFDTPGIEDSIGLLDYLEQLSGSAQRLDGPDRIRLFLDSPEASALYEQEARVLNKLLSCDAGLYVVDVREPVLAKHRDELVILSSCARPLLPVLNFVASDTARTQEWRDALARVGLHSVLSFDSMSPPIEGEEKLYQALSLFLTPHQQTLVALQER